MMQKAKQLLSILILFYYRVSISCKSGFIIICLILITLCIKIDYNTCFSGCFGYFGFACFVLKAIVRMNNFFVLGRSIPEKDFYNSFDSYFR